MFADVPLATNNANSFFIKHFPKIYGNEFTPKAPKSDSTKVKTNVKDFINKDYIDEKGDIIDPMWSSMIAVFHHILIKNVIKNEAIYVFRYNLLIPIPNLFIRLVINFIIINIPTRKANMKEAFEKSLLVSILKQMESKGLKRKTPFIIYSFIYFILGPID